MLTTTTGSKESECCGRGQGGRRKAKTKAKEPCRTKPATLSSPPLLLMPRTESHSHLVLPHRTRFLFPTSFPQPWIYDADRAGFRIGGVPLFCFPFLMPPSFASPFPEGWHVHRLLLGLCSRGASGGLHLEAVMGSARCKFAITASRWSPWGHTHAAWDERRWQRWHLDRMGLEIFVQNSTPPYLGARCDCTFCTALKPALDADDHPTT